MAKRIKTNSILPKAQPATAGATREEVNDDLDINLPADADDLSKHAPALFALKGTETGFVVPALYFEELSELVIAKTSIPEDGGLVVPEKYFEESVDRIIDTSSFDGVYAEPGRSAQYDKSAGLIVPENYFEELSEIIEAKISIPSEDGLVVPENYFEEFATNLESHIVLDNVKQDDGLVVPYNYFENLTDRVLAETSLDKDEVNNDEVPAGYFDALHDTIVARLEKEGTIEQEEERGRVIILSQWKKYTAITAVAAAIALLVVFTWTLNSNGDNGNGSLHAGLTPKNIVPDNYVHVVPQPVIDTNSSNPFITPEGIAAELPKNPNEIKPKVENVVQMNDDEIIAQSDLMDENMVMDFVAEHGEINNSDEVLDPAMIEYLMNDNSGFEIFDPTDK